jgi:hypothetical protein
VYADPPYWPASRRSVRSPYRYDYTEREHLTLLRILRGLPCPVMVSGYANEAYNRVLRGWKIYEFSGTSHVGARWETVWLNFQPAVVHDTRYLGEGFRQREAIKRKRARWASRFRRQPPAVQQALLNDLAGIFAAPAERAGLRR